MTIRTAEPTDTEAVAAVLAQAFHLDPVVSWLVPDPDRRRAVMPPFFSVFVADAIKAGSVDVLYGDDGEPLAAGTWFDETAPAPAPEESDQRLDEVFGPDLPRWRTLDRIMTENHFEEPHHYLFALGALPPLQGRGLGGRLLDHRHENLGPHPGYLEATSRDSMRLYQRKGYVLLSELPLPDGPSLWRMVKAPEGVPAS